MSSEAALDAVDAWTGSFGVLLRDLESESRKELIDALQPRTVLAGEVLIEFLGPVDALYVVLRGVLRSEIPGRDGGQVELGILGPGEFCGEMSFLRSEPASAAVTAITDTEIASIPHGVLANLADRHPSILKQLGAVVAAKLGQANQRLRQSSRCPVVLCMGIDHEWPARALGAVVASAANHIRRPVLVMTQMPWPTERPADRWLDSVTEALSYAHSKGLSEPAVHLLDVAACSQDGIAEAVPELRRGYGLIVIAATGHADFELAPGLLSSATRRIEFRVESQGRPVVHVGPSPIRETVLLRPSLTAVLPHGLKSLGMPGENVVAVLPGTVDSFVDGVRDPLTVESVDWLARHLAGMKVGVAFGAGGSKGFAHVGMIEALIDHGVPVDYSAGCSIGAPIAAAVADRMPLGELKAALDRTFARALRATLPYNSFLSTRSLRADFDRISRGRTFEELRGPLALVAVDQFTRSEVVLKEGSVTTAMLASMAIPGIFPPVQVGDRSLVDGALLNPIPNTTVAGLGADIVVGLRLSDTRAPVTAPRRRASLFRPPPIVDTVLNAFEVMQWKIAADGASRADIVIAPEFHGPTGLRDFARGDEFIEFGRDAVEAMLPRLRELLPWVH